MKSLSYMFLAAGLGLAIATPVFTGAAQAQTAGIALGTVQGSSDRGSHHQVGNIQDGNLTSAWGPHANDLMPHLIFNLGRQVALSTLEIKLSPAGAGVDVEMSTGGGEWRPVATGLRPQAETMARLALPTSAQGDRVRLKFTGVHASQLLVCEVRLFGEGLAWTPSPTPVPVPVPTATVGPLGPCTDATGGGWVASAFNTSRSDGGRGKGKGHQNGKGKGHEKGKGKGHDKHHDKHGSTNSGPARVTFGFNAHERVGKAPWGNIEVQDHGGGQRFKGRVTSVSYQGNTVTFNGALGNGRTFTAVVTDNGTAGRNDRFRFTTSTGYTADGNLQGGNIKVQRRDCR